MREAAESDDHSVAVRPNAKTNNYHTLGKHCHKTLITVRHLLPHGIYRTVFELNMITVTEATSDSSACELLDSETRRLKPILES